MADPGQAHGCRDQGGQAGKHFDGGGLYLEVSGTGSRYWRLKYCHGGREMRISFWVYPEVSLAEERRRRADARALLRDGKVSCPA